MTGALITLVIYLVIAGLIYYAVTTIVNALPIAEPFKTVINVIMIVICALICINALLVLLGAVAPGAHVPRLL